MKHLWWLIVATIMMSLVGPIEATAEEEGRNVPATMVRFDGLVTDYSAVLSDDEIAELEAILDDHRRATGVMIGLLVVPEILSPSMRTQEIEEARDIYALQAARQWSEWPSSRGDRILVVVTVDQSGSRIITEAGIQTVLSTTHAQRIVDASESALNRDYLVDGLHHLVEQLTAATAEVERHSDLSRPFRQRVGLVMMLILLLVVLQSFGWRISRDELHMGKDSYGNESRERLTDRIYMGEEDSPFFGISDLLWWVVPGAVVAGMTAGSGDFWLFYLAVWFLCAVVLAVGIGHINPVLWTVVVLWIALPLALAPGQLGMMPTHAWEIPEVWPHMVTGLFYWAWYAIPLAIAVVIVLFRLFPNLGEEDEDDRRRRLRRERASRSRSSNRSSTSSRRSRSPRRKTRKSRGGGGRFGGGGASGGW